MSAIDGEPIAVAPQDVELPMVEESDAKKAEVTEEKQEAIEDVCCSCFSFSNF